MQFTEENIILHNICDQVSKLSPPTDHLSLISAQMILGEEDLYVFLYNAMLYVSKYTIQIHKLLKSMIFYQ